ncbi:putative lipoprotein [Escherichia coli]|nr:putative lipoprotein [Escherichia coli]
MKLVHMASGLAVAIALAACADKSADIQTPAPAANTSISATQQPAIQHRMSPVRLDPSESRTAA